MKTILVVDDEEAVVEFVASLLEDVGYRVLRAYEGRSALEITANEGDEHLQFNFRRGDQADQPKQPADHVNS